MCKRLLISSLLTLLVSSSALDAQELGEADACYRFDRHYFSWFSRRSSSTDSTAVVLLAAQVQPGRRPPDTRALIPPSMVTDTFVMNGWLSRSGWRFIAADSISVWWYNGLHGPTFRFAVRGDSLGGQYRYLSDIVDAPSTERASAIRVTCPAKE